MKSIDVVQVAIDRLSELDGMQSELDAERAKLLDFLAMAEKLGADQSGVADAVAKLAISIPGPPTAIGEIRKRAAAIIGALNKPVPLGELYNALVRSGVVVGGKDPRSNLSAKLGGATDLVSLPGKGWVLRKNQGLATEEAARPYQNGAAG